MKNALNWFEIPVKNYTRAKSFYETVLDVKIMDMPHPNYKYGMIPATMDKGAVGGGIVEGEGFEPSMNGSIIYLNCQPDLNVALSKVETAGGKIIFPKTSIGGNGFMAHVIDTEENKIGLHSMQ